MKRPRVVKTTELMVEERAPPGSPEWKILESYPEMEKKNDAKPARRIEAMKPAGLFVGVGKWISSLLGK